MTGMKKRRVVRLLLSASHHRALLSGSPAPRLSVRHLLLVACSFSLLCSARPEEPTAADGAQQHARDKSGVDLSQAVGWSVFALFVAAVGTWLAIRWWRRRGRRNDDDMEAGRRVRKTEMEEKKAEKAGRRARMLFFDERLRHEGRQIAAWTGTEVDRIGPPLSPGCSTPASSPSSSPLPRPRATTTTPSPPAVELRTTAGESSGAATSPTTTTPPPDLPRPRTTTTTASSPPAVEIGLGTTPPPPAAMREDDDGTGGGFADYIVPPSLSPGRAPPPARRCCVQEQLEFIWGGPLSPPHFSPSSESLNSSSPHDDEVPRCLADYLERCGFHWSDSTDCNQ